MPFINYDENGNITGQTINRNSKNQLSIGIVKDVLKVCFDDEPHIDDISNYDLSKYKIIDNELIDISETSEYKAKIKAELIKPIVIEYKEYFNELDRICGAKFARGLCTTEQINAQRISLQNERNQKIQGVNNG